MKRALVIAGVAAAVAIAIGWPLGLQNWLAVHTGTVNEPGGYYGFWSGFGFDLGEITLVAAVLGLLRRHNCEVKGCWRLGRHATAAGHMVCRKHHPDDDLSAQAVIDAHQAAL